MNKIIALFIVAFFFISCSKKIYNSSSWQSNKVTIDGKINEWPNPLRFYDQETGISYNITNDRDNLYFVCSITNEFLQTKILRSGLEFKIDTLGKKSLGVSIKYPIGNISVTELRPNKSQDKEGSGERPDRSAYKLKLLAQATEIQLVGFKPRFGKIISLAVPGNSGISAAINFDVNGIMNYEAVIPFSTFYKNELAPSDSSTIFNFQIKVNPVPNSNNSSNSGTRGGGMRGGGMGGGGGMRGSGMGGGGMRGGGMRGGGMYGSRSGDSEGNGSQRNANNASTTKTTIKLKLAYR
ncbi:MAG: hypothetical protein ABR927_16100 [Bacteroidales bacterium]|jgi:hypothetical protein